MSVQVLRQEIAYGPDGERRSWVGDLSRVTCSDLRQLEPEWRSLAAEDACREPFYQPEFFLAFAKAFCEGRTLRLLSVRRDGALRGILPLVQANSVFHGLPARALRSMSGIHSCRCDLVHAVRDRRETTLAAWHVLRADDCWEVIEALDVPSRGAFQELQYFAASDGWLTASWPTRRSPYLPLSTVDDLYRYCPSQFRGSRHRLRSKENKLEREGRLRLGVWESAEPQVLAEFFELEASGWKGRRGSAIAASPRLVAFYTAVAQAAAKLRYLRIYALLLNDAPVAMHFGLLMNGCYYIPKVAYDERYRKCSPGLLLMQHVLKDLALIGAHKFDFLGPSMEWKRMWTDRVLEHSNQYIIRPTVKGRMLHALIMKAAPVARRIKYRISGDPQVVR